MAALTAAKLRYDWTVAEIEVLLTLPLPELIFRAQSVHRAHHPPDEIQGCALLSIKTGGCPEDCAYCPQSAHFDTGVAAGKVKIILNPSEIDKISEGDILVTEMTTPDFVPAMKRAKAIVTDKGGRTAHAAIVSRELGIPCVVGTEQGGLNV